MAISTRLGRCYRCSCRCSAHCIREQGAQGRQRGQGRNRLRRRARGAAYNGVEHPDRDLLRARDGRVHETAARRCARRSLDHLVKANAAPSPGMPGVDNRDLVASCRTMGLVVRSCTIGSTNGIEALNSKLRRAVRTRDHFPTDEAALKLLFLALNRSEKEWTMPAREWCMAKAQFAILFGERFTRAMA